MDVSSEVVFQVIIALAGGGFLASVVQGAWQRKKTGGDYAGTIAAAATSLVEPLTKRITTLEDEVAVKDKTIEAREKKIKKLQLDLENCRRLIRVLYMEVKSLRGGREPATPLEDFQDYL